MRLLQVATLALLCLAPGVFSKRPDPKISSNSFKTHTADLFFFDDTDTVLTIEREPGLIYKSNDAGASWSLLEDLSPGDPIAIYRSKFHPQLMIVIGREKQHWITRDQAKTWQSFKSPHHPSLLNPVSIHADDPDKILFHMQEPCIGCPGEV